MPELIEDREWLHLPYDNDPAIQPIRGWQRFLVGVDVGQAKDPSGFAIIRDRCEPRWGDAGQELGPRKRTVVRAEYLPPMSYTQLSRVIVNLMQDKSLIGRSYLAVDSGGPGRALTDMVLEAGQLVTRIALQGGESDTSKKERGVTYHNVGKSRLLSTVNSALHTGDLEIGNIRNRDNLRAELESFELEVTAAGRIKVDGGTDFSHADLAIATACAFWLSDHSSVGAAIGETRLAGYWG